MTREAKEVQESRHKQWALYGETNSARWEARPLEAVPGKAFYFRDAPKEGRLDNRKGRDSHSERTSGSLRGRFKQALEVSWLSPEIGSDPVEAAAEARRT